MTDVRDTLMSWFGGSVLMWDVFLGALMALFVYGLVKVAIYVWLAVNS